MHNKYKSAMMLAIMAIVSTAHGGVLDWLLDCAVGQPWQNHNLISDKLNDLDEEGFASLHHLMRPEGNIQDIDSVMRSGASVDVKSRTGYTPLHCAAHFDCVEKLLLLIEHNADVNARAKLGETPLHVAVKDGNEGCVRVLRKAKAEIDARDIYGWTPFHYAVRRGDVEIMKYLIGVGVSIRKVNLPGRMNDLTSNGRTSLHIAAKYGQLEAIAYLVKAGMKKDQKDNDGTKPFQLARDRKAARALIPDKMVVSDAQIKSICDDNLHNDRLQVGRG